MYINGWINKNLTKDRNFTLQFLYTDVKRLNLLNWDQEF